MTDLQRPIALLIDGDNAQPNLIPQILDGIKKYGRPIIKNVYGDPSQEQIQRWKPVLTKFGFEPKYTHHATSHKNATDIALVIDAMDILHEGKVQIFCIVSSDSDFTHLATRIKRAGLEVIGIGSQNSQALSDIYDQFIPIESFSERPAPSNSKTPVLLVDEMPEAQFAQLFIEAYKTVAVGRIFGQADGWLPLRDVIPALAVTIKPNPRIVVMKLTTYMAAKPGIIEMQEQTDSKPLMHLVRVPEYVKHAAIYMLYRVYHAEAARLQPKDEGWVLLSSIGSAFQAAYPNYDYRVYNGERSTNLSKTIERMNADYPNSVLLNADGMRLKMRVPKDKPAK